jgi:predicted nucleic acid-binding protein
MSIVIGLDASFVIGLLDEKDIWHVPASQVYADMLARSAQIMAFDCVLAESVSTLARRVHEKRRTTDLKLLFERVRAKFPTKSISWLYPEVPEVYDRVVMLVEQTAGELNFNDALIALACQQRGIKFIASFDGDFDRLPWLRRISQPADLP